MSNTMEGLLKSIWSAIGSIVNLFYRILLWILGLPDVRMAARAIPSRWRSPLDSARENLMAHLKEQGFSPPLLHVEMTEKDAFLSNIQHVKHGTVDPEDGLEKVIPIQNKKHVWPFQDCSHRFFDSEHNVFRFTRHYGEIRPDVQHETEIHSAFVQARRRLAMGQADEALAWYSRIVQLAPSQDDSNDYMLQANAFCHLGVMLSSEMDIALPHTFMKNDCLAALLFKVGAVVFQSPACMYFYASALMLDQGGVKANEETSIKFLNRAGSNRVGEAYFQLGTVYEKLGTQGGKVDMMMMAQEYYRSADLAYTFDDETDLDGRAQKHVSHIPPPGAWAPSLQAVSNLLPTEQWHSVRASNQLGLHLFWNLAGQAFLLGSSASLAGTEFVPSIHRSFLWAMPLLGMTLGVHALVETLAILLRVSKLHDLAVEMADTRIKAYGSMLEASVDDPFYLESPSFPQGTRVAAWNGQQMRMKKHVARMCLLKFMTVWASRLCVIAQLALIISWATLLASWLTKTDLVEEEEIEVIIDDPTNSTGNVTNSSTIPI